MGVTWRFYLTVIITVVGGSFQFYSFAVLNTTQTTLEAWMNQTLTARDGQPLTATELTLLWSLTVSILPVGGCIGSILTGILGEKLGRRNGLIANGVVNVVGGLFEALAKPFSSPELLILGRLILGMNIGLSCGLAPMYLTEIAPVRLRGAIGTTHQIAAAFGDWFCMVISLPQLFGGESTWPLALAFPAVPALLLCLVLPWCPQSPRYLMLTLEDKNRGLKAVQAFVETKAEAQLILKDLEREWKLLKHRQQQKRTLGEWFRRPELRRPLMVSILMMLAQQFTGIAFVLSYSSEIFTEAGLSLSQAQLATVGVGACYFVCTVPSMWLIEGWGRRCLSLVQLSGVAVCLALLSLFIGVSQSGGASWASWCSVGTLVLYMCVYGLGSPIPWLITSELFSQESRSAAVSVGTFTSFGAGFLVSLVYLPLQELVGAAFSFLPFLVLVCICIIFIALWLPETKNRPIEDIVSHFKSAASLRNGLVSQKLLGSQEDMQPTYGTVNFNEINGDLSLTTAA